MRNFLIVYCFLFSSVTVLDVIAEACPSVRLKNGRIRSRQRGRFLKFICNTGYLLAGERYSICTNGKWDLPPPKCVRPTCQNKAKPPENGLTFPSHGGGVLNFYCKAGYELRGASVTYCDGVRWDNVPPTCFQSDTKPKLFCDFETDDICSWTHDLNHHFDWKRESYQTPSGSIGTGPSFDHTKGAKGKNGHYMYIESSSRRENDTARLISPVFDKMPNNTCLEFWYHMFGKTTGTLRAYVKKVRDNWPLDPNTAIFSKSGNQGDVWYRSFHNLGTIDEDFQIVMEGVRGPGYVSDIAIDDIKLIENCNPEDYTYTTTEETVTVDGLIKTVESCENRCGHMASGTETNSVIACDCDDNCFDRNRCCPDFLDICYASFSSTPTYDESTATETETSASDTTSTTIRATKPAPTRRPLVILTPPPVPEIVERILPKQAKNVTDSSKITFLKPKKVEPSGNVETNDVIDVPLLKNEDNATTPLTEDEDNSIFEREEYIEEMAKEFDLPHERRVDESKKEFSQTQEEPSNVKLLFVVITACCGVGVLVIVTSLIVVRHRYIKCYKKRMVSGNGDSQSDVRFLTADEVLDFSLDRDYEDL